ncbi:TPA: hypothetical protein ACKMTB_001672 [Neisseria gonorrhoeae]
MDSKPLMKPYAPKIQTRYQAMKDELLKEAETRQSERGRAENGSLN